MALVAVVVLWSAYALVVVGVDKITGGCGAVKPMLWPTKTGGNLHVKCAGVAPSATPASTSSTTTSGSSTGSGGSVTTTVTPAAGTPGAPTYAQSQAATGPGTGVPFAIGSL